MLITVTQHELRAAICQATRLQRARGEDHCLTLEEHFGPPLPNGGIYQTVPSSTRSRNRSVSDSLVRFVQIACCEDYMLADLPNTVLSLTEAEQLHPLGFTTQSSSFEPTQKQYTLDQTGELAEDLEFIFCELWRIQPLALLKATIERL